MKQSRFDKIYEELLLDSKYDCFTNMAYEFGELPINKKHADLILSDADPKEKLNAKFIYLDNPNKRFGYVECECGSIVNVEARGKFIIKVIGDVDFISTGLSSIIITCKHCEKQISDYKHLGAIVMWEN